MKCKILVSLENLLLDHLRFFEEVIFRFWTFLLFSWPFCYVVMFVLELVVRSLLCQIIAIWLIWCSCVHSPTFISIGYYICACVWGYMLKKLVVSFLSLFFFYRKSIRSTEHLNSFKSLAEKLNHLDHIKGTLMQIWKSPYILKFI